MKLEETDIGGAFRTVLREYENQNGGPTIAFLGMVHFGSSSFFKNVISAMNDADFVLYEFTGNLPETLRRIRTLAECEEVLRFEGAEDLAEGLQNQMLAFKDIDFNHERYWHADLTEMPGHEEFLPTKESCEERAAVLLKDAKDHIFKRWIADSGKESTFKRDSNGNLILWEVPRDANEVIEWYKKNPTGARKSGIESVARFIEGRGTCSWYEEFNSQREAAIYSKLELLLTNPKARRILITYGAGHGPEIERNLRERFGYYPKKEKWVLVYRY